MLAVTLFIVYFGFALYMTTPSKAQTQAPKARKAIAPPLESPAPAPKAEALPLIPSAPQAEPEPENDEMIPDPWTTPMMVELATLPDPWESEPEMEIQQTPSILALSSAPTADDVYNALKVEQMRSLAKGKVKNLTRLKKQALAEALAPHISWTDLRAAIA